jgi:hypothetical protein
MKVLVKYVAFHPDHYQGGGGKSFEFTHLLEIPDHININEVKSYIENSIYEHSISQAPWTQDFKVAIQSIQLL